MGVRLYTNNTGPMGTPIQAEGLLALWMRSCYTAIADGLSELLNCRVCMDGQPVRMNESPLRGAYTAAKLLYSAPDDSLTKQALHYDSLYDETCEEPVYTRACVVLHISYFYSPPLSAVRL
jgi:hypothetical protein